MDNLNMFLLYGTVIDEPEVFTSSGGSEYLRFTLETIKYYKGGGAKRSRYPMIAFKDSRIQWMLKVIQQGDELLAQGQISSREYTTGTGAIGYSPGLVVESVKVNYRERQNVEAGYKKEDAETSDYTSSDADDDLPF